MAGWHISVFRLVDGGSSPAQRDSPKSTEIADWRAEFNGLRWIDDLVKAEGAVDLGGNGYPSWYTAQAKHLLQRPAAGPTSGCWSRCGTAAEKIRAERRS